MAGLTATGITIKDVDEILDDMESAQAATIDTFINVQPDSVLGQLNGIYAAALAEVWELLEEIYQSAYPDTASGQSLSYSSALTGAIRNIATKSEVSILLTGTGSATIPAGILIHPTDDADSVYTLPADTLLSGGGVATVDFQAVTPGSYANMVATDNPVTIAKGDADLSAVTVLSSASVGLDEETDSLLRIRREQTLALSGASTVEAIRAEMLQVAGVDSCTVFENPTGVTDAMGVPPYAIEVLVSNETGTSYTEPDVVDEILLRKPAGTQTYGGESATATDSAGNDYTIYYSEPSEVVIHVELTLVAEADGSYVGDAAVSEAVADWATRTLRVGRSVYGSDIVSAVVGLEGVVNVDVSTVFVEDTDPPTTADHILTGRELGTIAAANVDVTS